MLTQATQKAFKSHQLVERHSCPQNRIIIIHCRTYLEFCQVTSTKNWLCSVVYISIGTRPISWRSKQLKTLRKLFVYLVLVWWFDARASNMCKKKPFDKCVPTITGSSYASVEELFLHRELKRTRFYQLQNHVILAIKHTANMMFACIQQCFASPIWHNFLCRPGRRWRKNSRTITTQRGT